MKTTNFFCALAITAGLLAVSCSDDDELVEDLITPEEEEQVETPAEEEEPEPEPDNLTVSPFYETVIFSAAADKLYVSSEESEELTEIDPTFTVETSAEEWSVDLSSTWCTVTVDTENNTFTLSATPNTSDTDVPETAVVTVTAGTAEAVTISVTQQTVALDVYVTGYIYETDYDSAAGSSRPRTAGYWKNGEWTALVESGLDSYVRDIEVIDGDIYVSGGYGDADGEWHDGYWKNGTFSSIEYVKDPQVYEMVISGTDVYLCGYDRMRSAYWKNGVKYTILNKAGSYAYGMCIDGETLHFVGVHSGVGRHWSMTEADETPVIDTLTFTANSVCIDSGNLYIGGYSKTEDEETGETLYSACYSVNGDVQSLSSGTVNKIRVLDGKVVCTGTTGTEYTYAQYWVDGTATQLTTSGGAAYGTTSYNSSIYVAGAEYDSINMLYRAVYWKDGVRVAIDDETEGEARDIVIIAKE